MKRARRSFLIQPDPTDQFDELMLGKNIADGVIVMDEPLRSPLRGQGCAAFFYEGLKVIPTRSQPTIHKVKQAEVYAPFELRMGGGTLKVVPKKPGDFDQQQHMDLTREHAEGYHATEDLILPGAKVRVTGKVREVDGELVMVMKTIAVLEKRAVNAGVIKDRKQRRKKKKSA